MTIAIALQHRLIEAARRDLGPDGELIVRGVIRQALGCELEEVGYGQLQGMFDAIEREGAVPAGRAAAVALADELNRVQVQMDADLSERVQQVLGEWLGRAAEPCLLHICETLGLTLDRLERAHLPQIAGTIRQDGAALLGPAAADRLATAVTEMRRRPSGLAMLVIDVATELLGPMGEGIVRDLCHDYLQVDLDDLDTDGIEPLVSAVLRHGATSIGEARIAAFLTKARQAVVGPGESLRSQMLKLATHHLGPAGPVFARRACAQHEMPMEAISYEHLMWLAEVMYDEAVPLVGEPDASEFAAAIRRLLPTDVSTLGTIDSVQPTRLSAQAMPSDSFA